MEKIQDDNIRRAVRENYANIAISKQSGCGCVSLSCCSGDLNQIVHGDNASEIGYTQEDIQSVPSESNLGLGCGNPVALALLCPGEVVLDLGCGAGFDCFLAAQKVGTTGRIIGVDMTPEMISQARTNAVKCGFSNVEFRLGEIEYLPIADNSIDVILSNCVINLSPDKQQVFIEAFRVLKKRGRLTVSDIVATQQLPEDIKENLSLYTGCIAGATQIDELKDMMRIAGFIDIKVEPEEKSKEFIKNWSSQKNITDYIVSASIMALKP